MTGFGVGNAPLGSGRIAVEVRAVNGRFLDVRVRVPQDLADLSPMVETEARARLSRGRCDIGIRVEGAVLDAPVIDKARARAAYRALVELKDELVPGAEVPFSMLSSLPDLFAPSRPATNETCEKAVRAALGAALDDLELMRKKEGRAIADDLSRRLATVRELTSGIAGSRRENSRSGSRAFRPSSPRRRRRAIYPSTRLESSKKWLYFSNARTFPRSSSGWPPTWSRWSPTCPTTSPWEGGSISFCRRWRAR
jgi:uncharacterized protein YicC (UPF0701 family)